MMMKAGKLVGTLSVLALGLLAAPKPAQAIPVLGAILEAQGGDVTVQLLTPSAAFVSRLFLDPPPGGGPAFPIASNTDTVPVFNLGPFAAGTDLIFGIEVEDTEFGSGTTIFQYRMGPGGVNPDGIPHAQVEFLNATTATVGFEDKNLGTPGIDFDYNDLIFRFVGVGPENVIPEPGTMLLLGLGMVGAGLRGRKRSV
jgi:hypothetical protein